MPAGKRSGAARLALAAGLLACAAARAAEYRIGPAPAWVQPVALATLPPPRTDAANVAYGLRYDLIDDQVRLGPGTGVCRVPCSGDDDGLPGRGGQ